MQKLKVFENNNFGKVRVTEKDNQPWFVAKDVCECLDIKNNRDALSRLDDDEKGVVSTDTLGGEQDLLAVNEYGLYNLVLSSRKQSAKEFKRWITHDIIPSIRNNGGYIANQENMTPEEIVSRALLVAQNIIDEKTRLIQEMKPKAEFFDAVADSKTAVSMNEVAKVLGIKGLGRNNLFELLRNKGILMSNNQPYQKYVDCGYFRVIEQRYQKNSEEHISFKTLVYQRGLDFIRKTVE